MTFLAYPVAARVDHGTVLTLDHPVWSIIDPWHNHGHEADGATCVGYVPRGDWSGVSGVEAQEAVLHAALQAKHQEDVRVRLDVVVAQVPIRERLACVDQALLTGRDLQGVLPVDSELELVHRLALDPDRLA